MPATVNWINPTGGSWNTAANWRDDQGVNRLPTAEDDVVISANAGATITHSQNTNDSVKSILSSNPLTLSAGTLQVSGTFSSTATVTLSGGTLASATVAAGTTLQATNAISRLQDVTLAGTLNLTISYATVNVGGAGLTLAGGTVNFASSTTLAFAGTQTLGGTGTVYFQSGNFPSSVITNSGAGNTLTIGAGVTIRGERGGIDTSTASLNNLGTINASGGSLSINGSNWSNGGVITATNGGTINTNGSWTNTAAGRVTATGANFNLNGTWSNAGTIDPVNSTVTFNGTWTNNAILSNSNCTMSFGGTWSNPGTVTLNNGGTLNLGGTFTTAGIGTIQRNSGFVNLTGALNNTGATLSLDTYGTLNAVSGSITGGTIQTTGASQMTQSLGSFTLNGVTLDTPWIMSGGNGSTTLNVRGDLNLNRNLILNGSGFLVFAGAAGTTQNINSPGGTGVIRVADAVNSGRTSFFSQTTDSGTGSAPRTVVINAGVTVQGSGGSGSFAELGAAGQNWVNKGTVQAAANGANLTLLGNWTNQGTIQAANGGTVHLNGNWSNSGTLGTNNGTLNLGGSFTTAGLGTFSRNGGAVNLTGSLNNTGATLSLDATGSLNAVSGSITGGTIQTTGASQMTQSLGSFTLNGVTLDTPWSMSGGNGSTTLNVRGDLNLNRNLILNGSGFLVFAGAAGTTQNINSPSGTGVIRVADAVNSGRTSFFSQTTDSGTGSAPRTVVINPGVTVQGSGGSGSFAELGAAGQNWVNKGTVQAAANGANLTLLGNWTNQGTIQAANGGTVHLNGNWSSSGTLGTINGTLNLGGSFTLAGNIVGLGGLINLTGTLNNTGTLALSNNSGPVYLRGGTIVGGRITTAGNGQLVATGSGGTLDAVTLAGTVAIGQTLNTSITVRNGLTLDQGTVFMEGNGAIHFVGSQTLGGTGTVQFADNDSRKGVFVPTAGTNLVLGSGITVRGFSGGVGGSTGGTVTVHGTITPDQPGTTTGTITVQNATNYAGGTLTGGTWGAVGNNILRFLGANITTNAARIVLDGPNARFYRDTGTTSALASFATNAAGADFALRNGASLTTAGAFSNAGILTLASGSTFAVGGSHIYTQTAGTTTLQGGTLGGAATHDVHIQGGTLVGPGTINANLHNAGRVDLGSVPGILAVRGNFTQAAAGTLALDVGGVTPGTQYDQFNIQGTATLDGTLSVELSGGFGPSVGQSFNVVNFAASSGDFAVFQTPLFDGSPAFAPARTPTSFNLVTATNAPDLNVTNVAFTPASVTVGQTVAIQYTVHNSGSVTAAGNWTDSVYISADANLDASDALLGRVARSGGLPGLASYTGSLTTSVPGLIDGQYNIIVVTDSGRVVPDLARANNLRSSNGQLAVSVPVLALGSSIAGSIANGQERYYRLAVPPGAELTIHAQFATAGIAELVSRADLLPDRSTYDQAAATGMAAPRIDVASTQGGTVYLLLRGTPAAGSGQSFTLSVATTALSVDRLLPAFGNKWMPEVSVIGTKFTSNTRARLVSIADGTIYNALAVSLFEGEQVIPEDQPELRNKDALVATFDMENVPLGEYAFQVIDGGQIATAPMPFQVIEGIPGRSSAIIVAPAYARTGQPQQVTVTFFNSGDTVVPKPYARVIADRVVPEQQMTVLDAFDGRLPSGLGPRERLIQTLSFLPKPVGHHVKTTYQLSTSPLSDTKIVWDQFKGVLKPANVASAAWDVIWENFKASVGTTIGDLYTALSNSKSYLPSGPERLNNPYTVEELLSYEMLKASGAAPGPILTSSVDAAMPAPGLPLSFGRAWMQPLAARYRLGAMGRGWTYTGDVLLKTESSTAVTIETGTSARRFFLHPDGIFRSSAGAILTPTNGVFHLQEDNGNRVVFRNDGRVDYTEDKNGNRITARWTGSLLTRLEHSNGAALTIAYNAQGRILSVTESTGQVTTYGYDASGEHLISVTTPLGTTRYEYVSGQGAAREHALASVTYPDGTHVFYQYDARGRLSRVSQDDNANPLAYSYFGAGGYSVTDGNDAVWTYHNDINGQVVRVIDPQGHETKYTRDPRGLVTSTSFLGQLAGEAISTGIQYDTAGKPHRLTDALGGVTQLTFDAAHSALTRIEDANANPTTYQLNAVGNVESVVYADGTSVQSVYDAQGNLTQVIDRAGQISTRTFDSRGLLTSQTFGDGTSAAYTYDVEGRLLSATDPSGSVAFQYDAAGRILGVEYPGGRSLQFGYDAQGRRASSQDQDGFVVRYTYDSVGRLLELTDAAGDRIVRYTYDANGRVVRKDNGNGTYTTHAYDKVGNLLQLTHFAPDRSENSRFEYTYDAQGRRTQMTTTAGTTLYGYDAASQLTSVTLPDGRTIAYSYDPMGNRTLVSDSASGTTAHVANALNQYSAVGDAQFSYDPNGNLIARTGPNGETTYTYDARGRLIAVTTPTESWQYGYDVLGNRISTTHNGQTTHYLVDPTGLGDVVGTYDANGQLIARYTQGLGLVSQVTASGVSYYDFDGTGSTTGLSSADGEYVNHYQYLPFGEVLQATEGVANPFQFVGQLGVQNEGNGLNFMRARFYDPELGRFTSTDPLRLRAGDTNLQRYTGNDPVNRADPSGLWYVDLNAGAGFPIPFLPGPVGVGPTGGVILDFDAGGVRFYGGGGLSTLGPGWSATVSPHTASSGWNFGVQGGVGGLAGQFGSSIPGNNPDSNFLEGGLGSPGASVTVYKVSDVYRPSDLVEFVKSKWVEWESTLIPGSMASVVPGTGLGEWILHKMKAIIEQLGPEDPNLISGPAGYGPDHAVAAEAALPYSVLFENKSDASAPAQVVRVTQQLDADLDLSTFELGDFGFGAFVVDVPEGRQFYSTRIDARDKVGVYVDVTAGLDTQTGIVTWTFTSINPETFDIPVGNILEGFLPPNNRDHEGEGWANYIIRPKANATSGTVITAVATITFNAGLPDESHLDTPVWINTLDAGDPTSSVTALPTHSPGTFALSWSGSDDTGGSGIASYDVFVSDNGGDFVPFLTGTTQTSATFTGEDGHTYAFYAVATDNVGHLQAFPTAAQGTTRVDAVAPTSSVAALPTLTHSTDILVTWSGSDEVGGSGLATYDVFVSEDGGAFTPWLQGTAAQSATFTAADGHSYGFYSVATDQVGNRQTMPTTAQAGTSVLLQTTPTVALALAGWTYDRTSHAPSITVTNTNSADIADLGMVTFSYFAGANTNSPTLPTAPTEVGTYTVLAYFHSDNPAYTDADSLPVTFAITPASLHVRADDQTRLYGTSNPTLTGTLTGVVPGDTLSATYTTTATAASDVTQTGYAITPVLHDPDSRLANYTITSEIGTLTITRADQVLHWGTPSAIVYGTALSDAQLAATVSVPGSSAAGSLTYSHAIGTVLHAGSGQVLSVTVSATQNYNAASATVALDVTPAPLTIRADDKTMSAGSALPTLTATYTGFVNGDTPASLTQQATLSTTATTASPAGDYPIVVAGATSADYAITFVPGTLQVTPVNTGVVIQLESSAPLAVFGQPVTLTARVQGTGTPTGSITFRDGSQVLGVVSLNDDLASWTTRTLGRGSHTLTAVYSGDANFPSTTSAPVTQVIQTAAFQADPLLPGKQALFVGGTTANDRIALSEHQGQLVVDMFGGLSYQERFDLAMVSRVVVYGSAGNDILFMDSQLTLPALLDGGDGNDLIQGGGGNNILVGGAGSDLLRGGAQRDLLIGGLGVDALFSGGGEDVLIGGATEFDANALALCSLMQEWSRSDADYTSRIGHLTEGNGFNGSFVLSRNRFHPADGIDLLMGESGRDLFFADWPDLLLDRQTNERVIRV